MMTLEQLFITIAPKYLNKSDAKRVKDDVKDIDKRVEKLGNTIAKVGQAFSLFGIVAVKAFSDSEKAMSEFSGKAGMHLDKFEKLFKRSSERIARQTGVQRRLILQAQQEGTSLGLSHSAVNKVTLEAAKLHAGNQADIVASVTAAAAGAKYQLGSPRDVLRTIYAASQVGAGAVADYGSVFKTVAPSANLAGMSLHSTLGTMALLGGVAPSLSEGGTWFNSFLKAMAKPTNDANAMLQDRIGLSFGDLNARLSQDGGLQQVVNIIKDTFRDDELFSVFGRQEAVKFISSVSAETDGILRLEKAVRENTAKMPIAGFWAHFSNTFDSAFQQFQESINIFLEEFGKPIAGILKLLMQALTPLVNGIVALNRLTGGLVAGITTLVGSIGVLVAGFKALRFIFGGALLGTIGSQVAAGAGQILGGGGDGGGAPRSTTAAKVGMFASIAAAFASFAAFWKQIVGNIRNMFRLFGALWKDARLFGTWVSKFSPRMRRRMSQSKFLLDSGIFLASDDGSRYRRHTGNRTRDAIWNLSFKVMNSNILKIVGRLGVVVAILSGIALLFRWFTRKTDAAEEGRKRARERSRMRRHFEGGGLLDETTPLPGELDAAQIAAEQSTAWRKAEMSNFVGQFSERFFKWWAENILLFPMGAIPTPGIQLDWKTKFLAKINEWWEAFVTFIYEFMSAPLDWIKLWIARNEKNRQDRAANFWGGLADLMGYDRPERLKNQAALSDPTADGRTPIAVIPMDKADAVGFGLTGLPPQFETPEIRQRNILRIPELPIPRMRRMQELGYSDERIREAWMNQHTGGPNIQSVTVNQKIEVQGAGDPEAVARQVMQTGSSFMRQALDDALETAETPVVR